MWQGLFLTGVLYPGIYLLTEYCTTIARVMTLFVGEPLLSQARIGTAVQQCARVTWVGPSSLFLSGRYAVCVPRRGFTNNSKMSYS